MLWLWLIAAVLALLGWGAVWLFDLSLWLGLVFMAAAVLPPLGVLGFRRIRAATRAARLERELLRQASQHAEHADPARRAEVLELNALMKQSIAALKHSKLGGRGGGGALYALPWYVIVGPPAAGKTTALEQSGLTFITPRGTKSSKLKGTAGTKNCDWWFSTKAVLLDTAGRFVTEDDDQAEWFAFLDIIKKHRGARPLDGIIAAVNLEDVMRADSAQLLDLAGQLRTRIEEILTRLDMILPVYLVFTKADLISGFIEFWADLGKTQRGQIWGATFALDDARLDEPAAAFEEEFETLTRALHARMLERLPKEQVIENRARVLQFPAEFRSLQRPLAALIDELFHANPYQDAPLFRGFYFTSGTQVGRPLARILSNMMASFGLPGQPSAEARQGGEARSYFVTDLLNSVVFPDRNLAIRSSRWLERGARLRFVAVAGALLGAILICVPALLSYLDNRDLVDDTERAVRAVPRGPEAASVAAATAELDPLLAQVQKLEQSRAQFSITGWWGPHAAGDLYEPVHALYTSRLKTVLEGAVRERLGAQLRLIADVQNMDFETFVASYDQLRFYVLMGAPARLAAEKSGKRTELEWARDQLAARWAEASQSGIDPERLRPHAQYYLAALRDNPSWAWRANDANLRAAQTRLARVPLEEFEYERFLLGARDVPAVTARDVFRAPALTYREEVAGGAVEVPGAYTRDGWDRIKANLGASGTSFSVEPWVLGEAAGAAADESQASVDRLQQKYFERYVDAWHRFIGSLRVKTPGDVRTAADELRALADTSSGPYVLLFGLIAHNAQLDMSPTGLVEKGAASLKEKARGIFEKKAQITDAGAEPRRISEVERQLEPLVRFGSGEASSLKQYLGELRKLEVQLRQLVDSNAEPGAQFQSDLSGTSATVERMLEELDGRTRTLIKPLLMNPIQGSRAGVKNAVSSALGSDWKGAVWEIYKNNLAPRYPFSNSMDDLALAEFSEFFRPETGTLWQFVAQNLGEHLERRGNRYVTRATLDPTAFRGDFLACLQQSQRITDGVFGTGAEASVPFKVRAQSTDGNAEITLTIDGRSIVYRSGAGWVTTAWPGKGPKRGALLRVKAQNVNHQIAGKGDFGLFRLLGIGNLKRAGGGEPTFTASFDFGPAQAPVEVSVQPMKAVHPFAPGFFVWRCPPTIAGGSR